MGRKPPPVGGVTVHTDRLIHWLSKLPDLELRHVDVHPASILRLMVYQMLRRSGPRVIHCQISNYFGLVLATLAKWIGSPQTRLVYSVHSEYWPKEQLFPDHPRARLVRRMMRSVDLVIADNPHIESDMRRYARRTRIIGPFLPPDGSVDGFDLQGSLNLANLDAPVLVFNAYKLSYRDDGREVYGLNILLDAFFSLEMALTLIILIPQLDAAERTTLLAKIDAYPRQLNRGRIHVISRPDIEGWKVISKANLFVRPTITDGDALSVREALYFGVPCICSDCTIRPDGVVLFKVGDAADLAQKIVATLKSAHSHLPEPVKASPALEFYSAYLSLFEVPNG